MRWEDSEAKRILLTELDDGILGPSEKIVLPRIAWVDFKDMPAFKWVTYSQFSRALRVYRKDTSDGKKRAMLEQNALDRDRILHPRKTRDCRGNLVFDLSEAKDLLREDVKNGLHLRMKPSALRNSRPEYQRCFGPVVFKERIYQEVRRTKFLNWLEDKRNDSVKW